MTGKKDAEYRNGYNAGREGGLVDRLTQTLLDTDSTYDKGYNQGSADSDEYGSQSDGGGDSGGSGSSSGGGCFLTTACVEYAGLSDDCRELVVMRTFRDTYIQSLPSGNELIESYYIIAPQIVNNINLSSARDSVLNGMLEEIRKTVSLIESGKKADALEALRKMFLALQEEYVR